MPHTATSTVPPQDGPPASGEPDLTAPESYQGAELSCDLIMKGGITSGVVYPQATCRLATRYRLRRLGGASAGAIAAALGAAAEHHRQHVAPAAADQGQADRPAGFVLLASVPTTLGQGLGALFQPVRSTRPALALLMTAVAPGRRGARRVAATLGRLVLVAPVAFAVVLAATLVPVALAAGLPARWPTDGRALAWSVLTWLPGGLLLALLAAATSVLLRTARALEGNGYGLTNGHTTDVTGGPAPLTDWMDATIDATAGVTGGPLTFGDLWGAEATAVYRELRARQQREERLTSKDWRRFDPDVDLLVMTTNLTLRKPYAFPFSQDEFFYCPGCWQAYFPPAVLAHLERTSRPVEPRQTLRSRSGVQEVGMTCPRHDEAVPVRHLPDAADLPVVVAARLSLSFPLLVSAVPLLCVDYSRGPGHRELVTCWFSDGGIASNFPIHFFDAPLPSRPTFGITLDKAHPDYLDQPVWRPKRASSGIFPRSHEPTSAVQFVVAVVRTMQNWVDAAQQSMPGYRDRVTVLRTGDGEGGINLRMADELVAELAARGSRAAQEFADFDLAQHQWVRYRALMNALSESLDAMHARWPGTEQQEGFRQLVARYAGTPGDYRLDPDDACADARAAEQLMEVVARWEAAGFPATAPPVPGPRPRLRQMPPL